MPTKLTLADDETFVEGRSQETAARLVTAAADAGLKGSVRTTYNGYIVPSSILEDKTEKKTTKRTAAAKAETTEEGK